MDLWFCESSLTPKSSIIRGTCWLCIPSNVGLKDGVPSGYSISYQPSAPSHRGDDNEMSRLFMMIPPKKGGVIVGLRWDLTRLKVKEPASLILKSPKSLINSWRIGMHLTWSHGTSKEILHLQMRNFRVPAVWHQIQWCLWWLPSL